MIFQRLMIGPRRAEAKCYVVVALEKDSAPPLGAFPVSGMGPDGCGSACPVVDLLRCSLVCSGRANGSALCIIDWRYFAAGRRVQRSGSRFLALPARSPALAHC